MEEMAIFFRIALSSLVISVILLYINIKLLYYYIIVIIESSVVTWELL